VWAVKLPLHRSTAALAAVFVLGAIAHFSIPASAAGAGSPGVRPGERFPNGYFEYTASPGQVIQGSLIITDLGDGPGKFLVYAGDGLTSPYTGIVYANRQQPLVDGPLGNGEYGAGAWISVPSVPIVLSPQQQTTVKFTVTVPKDSAPGDHVGAISAENPEPTLDSSGQFTLGVTQRSVEAVVVHIPNPIDTTGVFVGKPHVTTENHKRQLLNIPLDYRADVLAKPFMNFTVIDPQKKPVVHFDGQFDTFVPHSSIVYVYPLDNVLLPPANYCFDGDFGVQDHEQHFHYCFYVTASEANVPLPTQRGPHPAVTNAASLPSVVVAGGGALIALFVLFLLLLRRNRCDHCNKRKFGHLIDVHDASDLRGCRGCTAQYRKLKKLSLCRACYRTHLRDVPAEPPPTPQAAQAPVS
jgi:Bacterial protein of unknown function (DUF916)